MKIIKFSIKYNDKILDNLVTRETEFLRICKSLNKTDLPSKEVLQKHVKF